MAFKMNGSPAKMGTISGTAGHGSALKMKAEENAASALKKLSPDEKTAHDAFMEGSFGKKMPNADWAKGQKKAKSSGRDLDALVKSRKGMKKGSDEYNATQNQINDALGSKKVHGANSSTTTKGKKSTTTSSKPGLSTKVESNKLKKNVLSGATTDITKSRYEDDKGVTTRKTKVKSNSEGDVKKTKKVIKTDFDKDGKNDKITKKVTKNKNDGGKKIKVVKKDKINDKKTKTKVEMNAEGKVEKTKKVTRAGGRRTVTKTDGEGNKTTKSRRTLKGFLTGKGKKQKEDSPADMKDKY
jgi:hypothetical protein